MQLFITDYKIVASDSVYINESRIISQCLRVLRYRIGQEFCIQSYQGERYLVELSEITSQKIVAKILKKIPNQISSKKITMLVAMPNKVDKIEFITQKLTEIAVDEIIFRPSIRSQIREIPEKKLQRLQTIILEATEQSWWYKIPTIRFIKKITQDLYHDKKVIVFDISDQNSSEIIVWDKEILWIIWPEWWLERLDYNDFWKEYFVYALGNTVLRMETAAIIGSWYIKHLY